jgi:hypothetical protein
MNLPEIYALIAQLRQIILADAPDVTHLNACFGGETISIHVTHADNSTEAFSKRIA